MPFPKRTIPFTQNEFMELSKEQKYYYRIKRPDLVPKIDITLKIKRNVCDTQQIKDASLISPNNDKEIAVLGRQIAELKLNLEDVTKYSEELYDKNKNLREMLLEAQQEIDDLKDRISKFTITLAVERNDNVLDEKMSKLKVKKYKK